MKSLPCCGVAMGNVPQDPWDAIKAIALEVRALLQDEASGELVYTTIQTLISGFTLGPSRIGPQPRSTGRRRL